MVAATPAGQLRPVISPHRFNRFLNIPMQTSTPSPSLQLSEAQRSNWNWWENNPMTYDWENTMNLTPGSREWFEEIDRRFLSASYFAKGPDGRPFGRYMRPEHMTGKKVLEIGCGMGTHAAMISRLGADFTAIDLTERAVQATRRRLEVFGLKGNIQRADAEHQPFADKTFDFVWSWGVIHHSSSFDTCVSEVARILKPGGRIMLMVYYRPCIVYYINNGLIRGVLMGRLLKQSLQDIYVQSGDGFYARVFNKAELTGILDPYFKDIQLSVVGLKAELFPIPRTRFKETLESWTPDWLASAVLGKWGSMIVAEAVRK
jgi:2-polyprenyl-3-methyl-5-hydroxy-6-metoxy-1,4-benzoquinol methylase